MLLSSQQSISQTSSFIKGAVLANNQQLDQANIMVRRHNSKSIIGYAITKSDGLFTIPITSAKSILDTFNLTVSHIGYLTEQRTIIKLANAESIVGVNFNLSIKYNELDSVKVVNKLQQIKITNDTITFNTKQFQAIDRPKVEDLLKAINGFSISPNGKIYFNGREIKKILIDNDDIAESNYTILSKNLDANIVGKVQVLKNYNSNRILKNFENTGDYAVNLTINDVDKTKPSIGLSVASDFNSKYDLSQDYISLKRKNKNIVLTKYNNVANLVTSDINYYTANTALDKEVDYDFVKVGSIQKPQLGDKYILNNNDFSLNYLSLIKIGTTLKLKSLLGYSALNANELALEQSQYKFVDTSWDIESEISSTSLKKYFYFQTSLLRDKVTKNNTGVYNLNIKFNPSKYYYNNFTKSNKYDSASQILSNDLLYFNFNASETIKLNSKSVAELFIISSKSSTDHFFTNNTSRYSDYLALPAGFNLVTQTTNFDLFNTDIKLSFFNSIRPTVTYKYGFQYNYQSFVSKNEIHSRHVDFLNNNILIPSTKEAIFVYKYHFYNELNRQFSNKSIFQINAQLGLDKYHLIAIKENFKLVHDIKLSYNYKFTDLKILGFSVNQKTNLPGFENYYPQMLLSDIGTVYNGSKGANLVTNNSISTNYVNTNLYRNINMSITSSCSNVKGDVMLNMLLRPMFTEYILSQQSVSNNFHFIFNLDKYLYQIKSKLFLNVTYQNSSNNNLINTAAYRLLSNLYSTKIKLVTGLPFSITLENQISLNLFNNKLSTLGSQKHNTSSQYEFSQKLNYKVTEKFYANIFYVKYFYENKSDNYHLLDGYFTLNAFKKYTVTLTLHNILNEKFAFQNVINPFLIQNHRYKINERYFLFNVNLHF